jgi:hypothetical protein
MRLLPEGWRRIIVLLFIIVLFTATSVYSKEFSYNDSEYIAIVPVYEDKESAESEHTYFEQQKKDYTNDELNYFKEIALEAEYGSRERSIHKWTEELKIKVIGRPSKEDLSTLTGLISTLNGLSEELHIRHAGNAEEANMEIYFIPHAEFFSMRYLDRTVYEENWGLGIVTWNELGEIDKAVVLISTDKPNQKERNHLIQEEITQSLGLLNDSWDDPESIFYQGWGTQSLTPRDQRIVQILYDDRVKPNMKEADLDRVLGVKENK